MGLEFVYKSTSIDLGDRQNVGLGAVTSVAVAPPPPAATPGTTPAPASNPTAVAAVAAAVVVGVVAVVKIIMVVSTAKDVVHTGTSAAAWARRKRDERRAKAAAARPNPRSATGGRTVAYRVALGRDPILETIVVRRDGRAVLVRRQTPVATFKPTEYQNAKIRSGNGEILIFTDQL
jgi:hypothetical protein